MHPEIYQTFNLKEFLILTVQKKINDKGFINNYSYNMYFLNFKGQRILLFLLSCIFFLFLFIIFKMYFFYQNVYYT
jgi:hypothetical protein